jgi:KUP system potassium uptake protein
VGALGVVFGDIGTSPLYTLRECLHVGGASSGLDQTVLFGVLSLIFWALTLVVTIKYLTFVMRADNHGEGGIFALLAILPKGLQDRSRQRPHDPHLTWATLLVVVGAALLYGDGAITPAISVLSAMEGLSIVNPGFTHLVVPLTCVILLGLFWLQKHGTGTVGKLFGPIMLLWFSSIGILGAYQIVQRPAVLVALSPLYAARYLIDHGGHGMLVLGSVVLAVTGGEALYADMGHFGRRPIQLVWLGFAMPALVLCYFGQGALLLREPSALANPFFALVPSGSLTMALVVLSSFATVIASQALISGAFSLTRQAMQLGYFPRVTVRHTASQMEGQVYIPQINWILAFACILLVLGFERSEHLAAAYGIAVTGTMAITSVVYYAVVRRVWGWSHWRAVPLLVLFLSFDLPFFAANAVKLVHGGWVPVLIGALFVVVMLIWNRGRRLIVEQYAERFPSLDDALPQLNARLWTRVPGTAVFMASSIHHAPPILMHFVERTHILAQTVVLLTVQTDNTPTVPDDCRYELSELHPGTFRLVVRYGFMEHPNIPEVMQRIASEMELTIDLSDVTYYLGRESLLATKAGRMGAFSESLFAFLLRNAVAADRHFAIPPRQVMEIGVQIDL